MNYCMGSFVEIPALLIGLPVVAIIGILGGVVAYRRRQSTTGLLVVVVTTLVVMYAVAWTFFAELPPF